MNLVQRIPYDKVVPACFTDKINRFLNNIILRNHYPKQPFLDICG